MEKKNNLSNLSQKELKDFEEELNFRATMFVETHRWWEARISKLMERIDKYNKSKDIDENLVAQLENERAHLNIKSAWELREKDALELKIKELEKCKEKYFYNNLANSFSKKNVPPPSGKV